MSDLSPECAPKRTFANASEFMGSRPKCGSKLQANLPGGLWRRTEGGITFDKKCERSEPIGMALHGRHERGGHGHGVAPQRFESAFAIATLLNLALVALQVVYGILAHSIALLADAGHNLGDVLALLLAWGAYVLARWHPTERYTYGFRSASILAPLLSAAILLLATGAIVWEAIRRFMEPPVVAGTTVMAVAGIAVVLNALAAWLFMAGSRDLNIRSAFLHMAADAGVSFGVVVAGGAILLTGWNWIDPLVSLIIAAVIAWGTWGLLRDAVTLSLQGVPPDMEPAQVRSYLEALPGVAGVHDLHIWAMSTTETALTCHLVMPGGVPGDAFFTRLSHDLHDRFGIEHPTVQIEIGEPAHPCRLAPEHVV
jgi:cobalt-zinc-cadmium efflux system protein